jgi:hypothetical protein
MFVSLGTSESSKSLSNITKVKVYLQNGIAEILDQHQDLMGKIDNNIIEIESSLENKIEKFIYVVQDAVFIVSTKGLDKKDLKGTMVYIYARRVKEINQNFSLDEITKQYEEKSLLLEKEVEKSGDSGESLKKEGFSKTSKQYILAEEIEFLKKVISVSKKVKS